MRCRRGARPTSGYKDARRRCTRTRAQIRETGRDRAWVLSSPDMRRRRRRNSRRLQLMRHSAGIGIAEASHDPAASPSLHRHKLDVANCGATMNCDAMAVFTISKTF